MGHYVSDADGNLMKIAGKNYKAYMPLGMIFASAVMLEEISVKRLNGQSLSITGTYKDFCNWVMNQGANVPTCNISTYASEMTTYGQCGKFVINNTSSAQTSGSYTVPAYSIKLPTITKFIEASENISDLGKNEAAGLPDITGTFGETVYAVSNITSGAFKQTKTYGNNVPTGSWANIADMEFKASYSNDIYSKSDTVQPPAVRYPYYIVVAQGVKPIALADMTKKAEKDASNLTDADVESWQKKLISGQYSMVPSANRINNIVDFTKSKYDHAVYTAPANGFVFIFYNGSSADLWVRNNTTGYEMIFPNRTNASVLMPVAKGDKVQFYSTNAGNTTYSWSAFYYAKE